jgi:hypothetical protein
MTNWTDVRDKTLQVFHTWDRRRVICLFAGGPASFQTPAVRNEVVLDYYRVCTVSRISTWGGDRAIEYPSV